MIEEKDRIKWSKSEYRATADATTFHQYCKGQITEEQAIRKLEMNNQTTITPEQFRANLRWLGWRLL